MALRTAAIDVAADTNVQVAGVGAGSIETRFAQSKIKVSFVPTAAAAVVSFAESAAVLTAGDGWPAFSDSSTGVTEEFELTSNDELWVRATEAGVLYVRWHA